MRLKVADVLAYNMKAVGSKLHTIRSEAAKAGEQVGPKHPKWRRYLGLKHEYTIMSVAADILKFADTSGVSISPAVVKTFSTYFSSKIRRYNTHSLLKLALTRLYKLAYACSIEDNKKLIHIRYWVQDKELAVENLRLRDFNEKQLYK